MKGLVLNLKGNYATFRKPFTTTSATTYRTIHAPAVRGLVGAIMGIDRSELFERTNNMRIAIEVCNKVEKDTQSSNLNSLKKGWGDRFPSNIEFLRNVEYNIYISWEDAQLEKLKQVLESRQFVYTPFLGNSQYGAKASLVSEIEFEKCGACEVVTLAPMSEVCLKDISDDILVEKLPVSINERREYDSFVKVCFPIGTDMKYDGDNSYKVNDKCIVFI